jgi:hypothetical protein
VVLWPHRRRLGRLIAQVPYASRGAAAVSADEMIACLGSRRSRWEIAAMIQALSQHPSLDTRAETRRLEAARAAMANWKSYSHACQARHNACRLRLTHR